MENYSIDQLYPKIEGPYERDRTVKHGKPVTGAWREPWMRCLAGAEWDFYEKIDGMNIRIVWDGQNVRFGGRTEAAILPAPLLEFLTERYTPARLNSWSPMILFGEGYGVGIQKGGDYSSTQKFILFDILTKDGWLERGSVYYYSLLGSLEIQDVPFLGSGTFTQAMQLVQDGLQSVLAQGKRQAEGLVIRLRDPTIHVVNHGRLSRPILKIKSVDFY